MPRRKDYDEKDVKAILERKTFDGPGFEDPKELPESDFASFATDEVEEDSK